MFERLLFSLFCLLPLSLVPLLFLSLLPGSELQLPCGRDRRALNPMRTRRMKSIASWRNTTLSQVIWAQPARQPARQLRLLRDLCSDLTEWIRRHRHGTINQVATWKTRKLGFSLKDKNSKVLLKSDLQELHGIYWFSANGGNWSYYYRVWPIQARSMTTSRRTIRTKSGSSWNSYQECARHGRIAEKSCVKGRWTFKKKIDWRPKHYYGAKSPNSGITEWSQLYEWLERF